jgi:hypothetical protein
MIGLGMGLSCIALRLVADPSVELNKTLKPNNIEGDPSTYFNDWQFTRALRGAKWKQFSSSLLRFANDTIHNTSQASSMLGFLAPFAADSFDEYYETRPSRDYEELYRNLLKMKIEQQTLLLPSPTPAAHKTLSEAPPLPAVSRRVHKPETVISHEEAESEQFVETGGLMLMLEADSHPKPTPKPTPSGDRVRERARERERDLEDLQTAGELLKGLIDVRSQVALAATETDVASQQTEKQEEREKNPPETDSETDSETDWLAHELLFHTEEPFLGASADTDLEVDFFGSIFSSPFE